MKSRVSRLLAGISLLTFLVVAGGCNPYNGEFNCKGAPFGSCAPTPEIYKDIIEGRGAGEALKPVDVDPAEEKTAVQGVPVEPLVSAYREAELKKITKLLKQPVTPVVVPPKVMRILFMPFESEEGILNMPEYAFIMLDKPKWVMGDYLIQKGDR